MGTTATARMPSLAEAAEMPGDDVLSALGSGSGGLTREEAGRRLATLGPNVLRDHGASAWRVFANQLRNPLLPLLVIAAIVSGVTGQVTDAGIIVLMVVLAAGLG